VNAEIGMVGATSDFFVKETGHETRYVVEFRKDGTFTSTRKAIPELKDVGAKWANDETVTGKYSFVTESEIEFVLQEKERFKVKVTKEALILRASKWLQSRRSSGGQRSESRVVAFGLSLSSQVRPFQ
jgi:hypothetical protein